MCDNLICKECEYVGEYTEFVPTKKAKYKLDLLEMLDALENYELMCPRCESDLIDAVE